MFNPFNNGLLSNNIVKLPVRWGFWLHSLRRQNLATVANYICLPPPSHEQDIVIKALKQGRNARVNAVAGSGKTTTILQIAKALPNRKILGTTKIY